VTSTLIIGNHLSAHGRSPTACEELSARLAAGGWPVLTASNRLHPALRLGDMVGAVLLRRTEYQVAQVDVYSGRAFLWAEAVCAALRACGKPFVLTLHGGALPEMARREGARVARLLRAAAAVTAPSRYLRHAFSTMRPDLELLPNALDLAAYRFRPRRRPEPRLIWLRAFHEIYDSILAVETLAELNAEMPGATLTMIGPDKGDGSLERSRGRARELALTDSVSFPGRVNKRDVPSQLEQGDIFINTSRIDNTPVSVLEAMAAGMCIVSTGVGGIPDLLEDGVDALLVPAGNPRAMADAIRRIRREPDLAEQLSRNARRKVSAFDWSAILPRWQRILAEAAA